MFYWLEQGEGDVPDSDAWLSHAEREQLSAMHVPKRRIDWRLGRWTAKLALAAFHQLPAEPGVLSSIELRPAALGAPVVFMRGEPSALAISLSHSNGVALFVISPLGVRIGCDLEKIEPRSTAFTEDYCSESELCLVEASAPETRALLVNLIWSAKESILKLLGIGLREDTRSISVFVDPRSLTAGPQQWLTFNARSSSGQNYYGLWSRTDVLVRTVAAEKHISRASRLEPYVSGVFRERTSAG